MSTVVHIHCVSVSATTRVWLQGGDDGRFWLVVGRTFAMQHDNWCERTLETPVKSSLDQNELQFDETQRKVRRCKCQHERTWISLRRQFAADRRRHRFERNSIQESEGSARSAHRARTESRWRRGRGSLTWCRLVLAVSVWFLLAGVDCIPSDDWDRFDSVSESIGGSELESLRWVGDGVRVSDGLSDSMAFVGKAFSYRIASDAFDGYVDRYEVSHTIVCTIR